MSSLILQHPEWSDGDYDVLADGVVVGRIMKASAAPEGTPWLWTLIFGYHEDHRHTVQAETPLAALSRFPRPALWSALLQYARQSLPDGHQRRPALKGFTFPASPP